MSISPFSVSISRWSIPLSLSWFDHLSYPSYLPIRYLDILFCSFYIVSDHLHLSIERSLLVQLSTLFATRDPLRYTHMSYYLLLPYYYGLYLSIHPAIYPSLICLLCNCCLCACCLCMCCLCRLLQWRVRSFLQVSEQVPHSPISPTISAYCFIPPLSLYLSLSLLHIHRLFLMHYVRTW